MLTRTDIETRAYAFQNYRKGTAGDEFQETLTFEKDLVEVFMVDLPGVTDITCTISIKKNPEIAPRGGSYGVSILP